MSHLISKISSCIWLFSKEIKQTPEAWKKYCNGSKLHGICIVSNADLHKLDFEYNPDNQLQTFFHNKFFIEKDRIVMDCAEE